MDVSVFNIVSEALDLLDFSSKYAIENAGMNFTYVLVLWKPSQKVLNWIHDKKYLEYTKNINIEFKTVYYKTNNSLEFLPNLRNCFNVGFNKAFEFNDYTCGINTDMMFYYDWLLNLYKYRKEDAIINCREIDPKPTIHHEVKNFGITNKSFPVKEFYKYCDSLYEDKCISEEEWKGPRADSTPHLMYKNVWNTFGPWNVNIIADVNFFNKIKRGGIKNMKSLGSIVYHYGKGETRRRE